MVQAVNSFTGLPIDHYVEVNFSGFRNIVDTLGGVRVRFSQPVNDPDSGLNVPAGCVTLGGDQALAFVRVRHVDSDYGRIARQQFFVQLVMKQVLTAGTLLNPLKVIDLVNAGAGNVTTDSGLGAGNIEKLAVQLRNFTARAVDRMGAATALTIAAFSGPLFRNSTNSPTKIAGNINGPGR